MRERASAMVPDATSLDNVFTDSVSTNARVTDAIPETLNAEDEVISSRSTARGCPRRKDDAPRPIGRPRKLARVRTDVASRPLTLVETIQKIKREKVVPVLERIRQHEAMLAEHKRRAESVV